MFIIDIISEERLANRANRRRAVQVEHVLPLLPADVREGSPSRGDEEGRCVGGRGLESLREERLDASPLCINADVVNSREDSSGVVIQDGDAVLALELDAKIRERRICDELVEEVFVAVVRGVFPLARGENRVRVGGRSVGRATTFSACPPRRDVFVSQERVLAVARVLFPTKSEQESRGLPRAPFRG